jgi:glycosyltransferase involved in cell wall biosynthesis
VTALYLSYDGLMEQLGQSQVLPYLRGLARGRPIILVTYEKGVDLDDVARRARFAAVAREAGIRWIPLRYHRRPSTIATAYDLAIGFAVCVFLFSTSRIQIVHARGYVASVLALWLKRIFGVRFIFDMRGFWVDQRVELGIWREGSTILRFARWMEAKFLQRADVVFALSSAAVLAMKQWPAVVGRPVRFEVVTTCADLELFRPPPGGGRARAGEPFTLGYVGNAGRGYQFDPVLEMYLAIRRIMPEARLKIVNRNDHALIKERLSARGIDIGAVELIACDYQQVPSEIWGMDLGLFFYEWRKTHVSSVPTRMGEFLACGVPCVSDVSGAGIVDILEKEGVGIALRALDDAAIDEAAVKAISLATRDDVRKKCVDVAQRYFSLEAGVATYERIYRELEGVHS